MQLNKITSICKISPNGNKVWRAPNGRLHREVGPAIEF